MTLPERKYQLRRQYSNQNGRLLALDWLFQPDKVDNSLRMPLPLEQIYRLDIVYKPKNLQVNKSRERIRCSASQLKKQATQ